MQIKNWKTHQHYKGRRPPWIKLHRALLDDEDFHNLSPQAVKTLMLLWILASEDETMQGMLPNKKKIAFRLRMSEKLLESSLSELNHWVVQDASNVLADCKQLAPSEAEVRDRGQRTEGEVTASAVLSPKRKVLRSISDEDKPTDKHFAYGQRLGVDVGPEWGKFVSYCKAHDRRYADFDAAFRNWLANANTFKGGKSHAMR